MPQTEFTHRLKRLMLRQNVTRDELARRSGVQPHVLRNYLNGVVEPLPRTAYRMALALGLNSAWWIYHDESMEVEWNEHDAKTHAPIPRG